MRRRAGSLPAAGIRLFPLLAVFICTTGALVTLLVAFARQGQIASDEVAAESSAVDSDREALEWRIAQLQQSRDKTQADLNDARLGLSHLEDHLRRLRERAERLRRAVVELVRLGPQQQAQQTAAAAELDRLRQQLRTAEQAVADAARDATNKPVKYSVVPYEGPFRTNRRPIYLECRKDSVVLQPEGIVFADTDFQGPMGPGNPLASALRAAREYLADAQPDLLEKQEPYPLLIVRPDAIEAYYLAQAALQSWGSNFGYELVGADWQLDYSEPDPQMAAAMHNAIAEARIRQQQLIAAAPKEYRKDKPSFRVKSQGGGIEPDGGSKTARSRGSNNPYRNLARGGSSAGGGGGGPSRGTSGTGQGPGGNAAAGGPNSAGGGGPLGSGNGPGSGPGGNSLAGGPGGGSPGGGSGPGGAFGGNGLGTGPGGGGLTSGGNSPGGTLDGSGPGAGGGGDLLAGSPAGNGLPGVGTGPGGTLGGSGPGGGSLGAGNGFGGTGSGGFGSAGASGGNALAGGASGTGNGMGGNGGSGSAGGAPGSGLFAGGANGGGLGNSGTGGSLSGGQSGGQAGGSSQGGTGSGSGGGTPGGGAAGPGYGNGGLLGTGSSDTSTPGSNGSGNGNAAGSAQGGTLAGASGNGNGTGTAKGPGGKYSGAAGGLGGGGSNSGQSSGTAGSGDGATDLTDVEGASLVAGNSPAGAAPGSGPSAGGLGTADGNGNSLTGNGGTTGGAAAAGKGTGGTSGNAGGSGEDTGPAANGIGAVKGNAGSQLRGTQGGKAVAVPQVAGVPSGGGGQGGSSSNAGSQSSGSPSGGSQSGGSQGGASQNSGSQGGQSGSGGSSNDISMQSGQPQPVGLPMPSLNFGQKPQVESVAKSRGKDWALPDSTHSSVPVTRPVVIVCSASQLTILTDDGKGASQVIPLGARTTDSVDELRAAVWDHMKGWGGAGKGFYWKPTVTVRVMPDGRARYAELQTLFAGSGLDLQESTRTAGPSTQPPAAPKKRWWK